jgi:hypothetical protein
MKKEEALKALEKLKMIIVHQQEIQEVKPKNNVIYYLFIPLFL